MDESFGVPLHSEDVVPFAARVVGVLWARCEAAKSVDDGVALRYACEQFWRGVWALHELALAISTAAYFSVAASNEIRRCSSYIESVLGVSPIAENWPH